MVNKPLPHRENSPRVSRSQFGEQRLAIRYSYSIHPSDPNFFVEFGITSVLVPKTTAEV